ncbi:MAG: pantoate--beta-alanine ligase [Candidatus Eremiobacteraeota bacterium]|nr:pantoate--beta-alanine ligase [Candidatus Eremiobacteraeota bacterium]MBV9055804.1 pantoate--beta-alanine ligase [Candidatus Eremiobacteraeota bacterium]
MELAHNVARARALFGASERPLAFVPTMGALHDGHLELVRRARGRAATVAVSIFVNPLQFGPDEDFAAYPRDAESDRAKLEAAGADILFLPEARELYPRGFSTLVEVGSLGTAFEGAYRPHHFRGVTTIVAKLLNIVAPDVLVLGEKDAQQAAILQKMIADLNIPVDVEMVATVREDDGLALSSRNRYLDETQRARAPSLYRALTAAREALEGKRSKEQAIARGRAALAAGATLDYLDLVDPVTFATLERSDGPALLVAAARFGTTRLIDNVRVNA